MAIVLHSLTQSLSWEMAFQQTLQSVGLCNIAFLFQLVRIVGGTSCPSSKIEFLISPARGTSLRCVIENKREQIDI